MHVPAHVFDLGAKNFPRRQEGVHPIVIPGVGIDGHDAIRSPPFALPGKIPVPGPDIEDAPALQIGWYLHEPLAPPEPPLYVPLGAGHHARTEVYGMRPVQTFDPLPNGCGITIFRLSKTFVSGHGRSRPELVLGPALHIHPHLKSLPVQSIRTWTLHETYHIVLALATKAGVSLRLHEPGRWVILMRVADKPAPLAAHPISGRCVPSGMRSQMRKALP